MSIQTKIAIQFGIIAVITLTLISVVTVIFSGERPVYPTNSQHFGDSQFRLHMRDADTNPPLFTSSIGEAISDYRPSAALNIINSNGITIFAFSNRAPSRVSGSVPFDLEPTNVVLFTPWQPIVHQTSNGNFITFE